MKAEIMIMNPNPKHLAEFCYDDANLTWHCIEPYLSNHIFAAKTDRVIAIAVKPFGGAADKLTKNVVRRYIEEKKRPFLSIVVVAGKCDKPLFECNAAKLPLISMDRVDVENTLFCCETSEAFLLEAGDHIDLFRQKLQRYIGRRLFSFYSSLGPDFVERTLLCEETLFVAPNSILFSAEPVAEDASIPKSALRISSSSRRIGASNTPMPAFAFGELASPTSQRLWTTASSFAAFAPTLTALAPAAAPTAALIPATTISTASTPAFGGVSAPAFGVRMEAAPENQAKTTPFKVLKILPNPVPVLTISATPKRRLDESGVPESNAAKSLRVD